MSKNQWRVSGMELERECLPIPYLVYFIVVSFFAFSIDVAVKLYLLIIFCLRRISISC